jgi:hypothetical protein
LHDCLDDIYYNASYFAGYTLEAVEGKLELKEDVAAKQNHSSAVCSYLGNKKYGTLRSALLSFVLISKN